MFDNGSYQKNWRKKNKDKLKANLIKHRYGISIEDYNNYLKSQTTCSICGLEFKDSRDKHYDHDHKTNKFRGILCSNCNIGLGNFQDSKDNLYAAINYLLETEEKSTIST